ncbi:FliM/FliN family flagellar motor switch protein [Mangrovicoccus sp. HB182678]|uniref:FliM/FliN family flagellar motor switch protein n=2 Tax=Mangrovicoccus algicola TaxID=2771008 RepID=A0A8J6Z8U5_9RHOB|nr:FliM/FliN family flagellar motor switch protein [Mangrovicoccus algicola]
MGIGDIRIEIRVVLGKARLSLSEILALSKGSVLPLGRSAADPVELYIGDRMIGTGDLEEVSTAQGGNQLAIRLGEIRINES